MRATAIGVSGEGTNLTHFIRAGIPVSLVFADRECPALEKARAARIRTLLIPRSFGEVFDREAFSTSLANMLDVYDIERIALAGFRTILSSTFTTQYEGRMINSHPSLLPKFPGPHAVREALSAGVKWTGCTIHYATAEVDRGAIIDQTAVRVLTSDTEDSLRARIQAAEHPLYAAVLLNFIST